MIILGIETSCDETALALIDADNVRSSASVSAKIRVLADKTLSQAQLHAEYGGVFPNLAKREHVKNLPLMLPALLREAGLDEENPRIDAIAVTVGPGLEPCLWTGITFAEALAKEWNMPIVVPVNHMEGHIFSALLRRKDVNVEYGIPNIDEDKKPPSRILNSKFELLTPSFPTLALLISGGHTELVLIKDRFNYEIVGQTRDDAVGEAFDKVARLLGLPYPGGPEISRLAEQARSFNSSFVKGGVRLRTEDLKIPPADLPAEASAQAGGGSAPFSKGELRIGLPRPMLYSKDFDFSFSGLKTAVLYLLKKTGAPDDDTKAAIAKEFEDAITEVLVAKTKKALGEFSAQALLIGGGVVANANIRREFKALAAEHNVSIHIPEPALTTDNALMVAVAGLVRHRTSEAAAVPLIARGNLRLGEKI